LDNERDNSEGMTLSQVCDALHFSRRKVQYLREQEIVVPSTVGVGRGSSCLYALDDIVLLWVALVELDGMDYDLRRKIVEEISNNTEISLGSFSSISVRLEAIRDEVTRML
jgi:hypothetical protein